MHLQKVMAGAGEGQLEEVQTYAPTAARWNGEEVQQVVRRQVVYLDALTRQAGAHVFLHSSRQAGPPQAARQDKRLVAAKVPAQQSGMQLVQNLCLKRAGHNGGRRVG